MKLSVNLRAATINAVSVVSSVVPSILANNFNSDSVHGSTVASVVTLNCLFGLPKYSRSLFS